jgi:hypothetical protein
MNADHYAETFRFKTELSSIRMDQYMLASTVVMYGIGLIAGPAAGVVGKGATFMVKIAIANLAAGGVKKALTNKVVVAVTNFTFNIVVNLLIFEAIQKRIDPHVQRAFGLPVSDESDMSTGMHVYASTSGFATFAAMHGIGPVASFLTRKGGKVAGVIAVLARRSGLVKINAASTAANQAGGVSKAFQFAEMGIGLGLETGVFFAIPYVGGEIGSLGNDAKATEASEAELISVWETLERHGVNTRPRFTKIVSAKKLYHLDSLERLEKAVI